jgi:hypothetical protein
VTVADDADAAADTDVADPPPSGDAVIVYPETGLPPSSAGGCHDTSTIPARPSTEAISGPAGTSATNGTTGADNPENADVPPAFDASTLAV